jgi:hypothetical protein
MLEKIVGEGNEMHCGFINLTTELDIYISKKETYPILHAITHK